MEFKNASNCFVCCHPSPKKPYPYDSLKWFESLDKLCADHIEKLKSMKAPAEKYVLKSNFVPKKVEVRRDYTEREPNDGSLIE